MITLFVISCKFLDLNALRGNLKYTSQTKSLLYIPKKGKYFNSNI